MKIEHKYFIPLLFICLHAWSGPECVFFYSKKEKPGDQTMVVGNILGSTRDQIERAVFEFSDLNLDQIKAKLRSTPGWEQVLLENQNLRLEKLTKIATLLNEGKFLLSPLHHALFLKAAGLGFSDSTMKGQSNYIVGMGALTQKSLKPVKDIVEGNIADSQSRRELIAINMASYFNNFINRYVNRSSWSELSQQDKVAHADIIIKDFNLNIRYVKITPKDIVPALDAWSKIAAEPDGLKHLIKIFEYLLPENLKIAQAQARGATSSVIKYGVPTSLGTLLPVAFFSLDQGVSVTQWIAHYVAAKDMMLLPLVTMGGFLGTGIMSVSKVTAGLPDLPGRVKSSFVRRRLQQQTIDFVQTRAQTDIHLERDQLKALHNETEIVDRLDVDFNAIKADLKLNSLFSIIEISEWQNAFKEAVNKLAERTSLLEEKSRRLKHLTDELILTARQDHLSTTTRAKNLGQMSELDNALSNQVAQIVQFQMDLLYLAAAYDRYLEKTNKAIENPDLSHSQLAIIDMKQKSLVTAKSNLTAMAAFATTALNSTISFMQMRHDAETLQSSIPILKSLDGPQNESRNP
ncbi:MAG: hypothetical protein JNL11_09605 [Bdellovibrionaceae bacterium]|nr:hypothetical protein [Pseudobdellovibrionaceae bacterium]